MFLILVQILSFLLLANADEDDITRYKFPDDFKFGVATASYQVEGAWNEDGKSENIWDYVTHNTPDFVAEKHNGDVACDSYHLYEVDVQNLKYLGVYHYRFSISWSRILPDISGNVNPLGIDYYNRLIDALLAEGIEPLVTIYHWDLPQYLQDIGGWTNEAIVDYYETYVNVLFENFGNRVKYWLTFNEAFVICHQGYGSDEKAPVLKSYGIGEYLCTHNLLKSHARAYHLYEDNYRADQNGNIGITLNIVHFEPYSNRTLDLEAQERAYQFQLGWFAHPIFSEEGNYPQIMIDRITERSEKEGFSKSRLPEFTPAEVEYIKGTYDYIGINHYSTRYVIPDELEIGDPSFLGDQGIKEIIDPEWPLSASDWLQVVPWGMRKLMVWIKNEYGDVPIIITENGYTTYDNYTDDDIRISYYQNYLSNLLEAMVEDEVNVIGYTAWSLMDNFEWISGYTEKFGLFAVDFDSEERTRTKKKSADYFKNVIATKCLLTLSSCDEPGDGDGDGDSDTTSPL